MDETMSGETMPLKVQGRIQRLFGHRSFYWQSDKT